MSTHLLQEFDWEVLYHPPYNPDLAPSIFHLFINLEKFLFDHRHRFQNDGKEELCVIVVPIQGADFYDTGIQKLVPRYDIYVSSSGGEYVEK